MIREFLRIAIGLTLDVLAALALISLNFPGAEAAPDMLLGTKVLDMPAVAWWRYCLGFAALCWPRGGQCPWSALSAVLAILASHF